MMYKGVFIDKYEDEDTPLHWQIESIFDDEGEYSSAWTPYSTLEEAKRYIDEQIRVGNRYVFDVSPEHLNELNKK